MKVRFETLTFNSKFVDSSFRASGLQVEGSAFKYTFLSSTWTSHFRRDPSTVKAEFVMVAFTLSKASILNRVQANTYEHSQRKHSRSNARYCSPTNCLLFMRILRILDAELPRCVLKGSKQIHLDHVRMLDTTGAMKLRLRGRWDSKFYAWSSRSSASDLNVCYPVTPAWFSHTSNMFSSSAKRFSWNPWELHQTTSDTEKYVNEKTYSGARGGGRGVPQRLITGQLSAPYPLNQALIVGEMSDDLKIYAWKYDNFVQAPLAILCKVCIVDKFWDMYTNTMVGISFSPWNGIYNIIIILLFLLLLLLLFCFVFVNDTINHWKYICQFSTLSLECELLSSSVPWRWDLLLHTQSDSTVRSRGGQYHVSYCTFWVESNLVLDKHCLWMIKTGIRVIWER